MKLSKKRLRMIILEEISAVVEASPYHDAKGRFSNKSKAKIYSLTANAKDDVATDGDLEVPARGKITSTGKVGAKYGMNTGSPDKQCGRLSIDGTEKKKTRSCKDYPENYWAEDVLGEDEIMSPADDAYIKGLVVQQVKSALQAVQKSGGAKGRGCSWDEIMRAINDVETATKARKQEK